MTSWAEAQQTVIGSLLLEPERYAGEIFQRARPEHFGDAALRHLFEAALGLWDADRPIDPVTLLHAAGDDYKKTIADCMGATPTAANVVAWCGILRERAQLDAMQKAAMRILNAETAAEAGTAYENMGRLMEGSQDAEVTSVTELISQYLDRMQSEEKPDYLNWGIDALDQILAVSPGKFVILAADSSVGKTALALQFAWHIAEQKKRVGFVSIETDRESLADRLMAEKQVAGIPLPSTKKKSLTDEDFRLAAVAGAKSDEVPMWIIRRCETLEQIRAQCVMRKLDVVFVDYVQLIDAPGRERWDIVTNISMGLHRMAQSLGITVVGLSQITPAQKGGKQAPTKDDLRESRQLKQDADVIMILSPSTEEDDPEDTRVLQVAKNKDGRCGKIKLRFEPQYMSFSQLVTVSGLYSEGRAAKNRRSTREEPDRKTADRGEEDLPF